MTTPFEKREMIGGQIAFVWSALASGDDGAPSAHGGTGDRTVQVAGTFGTGSVTIEGSLDGVDWFTLHDVQGVALVFATAGLRTVLENATYIRPRATGDGTTSINVILSVRR